MRALPWPNASSPGLMLAPLALMLAPLCKTVLHRGHPTGWPATNRYQADISDRHLFDFQLVASDYTDCPLRYTRLSSILNQKAGHSTCHLQVHQKLTLTLPGHLSRCLILPNPSNLIPFDFYNIIYSLYIFNRL